MDATYDLTLQKVVSNTASSVSTNSLVPFWGTNPDAWDSVILMTNIRLPGVAVVSGSMERRVEKKKSPGKHGSTVTYLGDEAAEFTIRLMLWTEEHLNAFTEVVRAIMDKKPAVKGNTAKANTKIKAPVIQVYHPVLAIYGITQMHVLGQKMPEHKGQGIYEAEMKCIEYLPPDKKGAADGVNTPKAGDAKTGVGDLTKLKSVHESKLGKPVPPSQTNAGPRV